MKLIYSKHHDETCAIYRIKIPGIDGYIYSQEISQLGHAYLSRVSLFDDWLGMGRWVNVNSKRS